MVVIFSEPVIFVVISGTVGVTMIIVMMMMWTIRILPGITTTVAGILSRRILGTVVFLMVLVYSIFKVAIIILR